MGCFLGCFGGEKAQKRRKQRVNRASPRRHRNRIQSVVAEQSVKETDPVDLVSEVSELGNKAEVVEQPSPSSRKRVTFNSNVTTYEHVPVHESIDSLPDCAENDDSVASSVGSYPPNHRYHNARESDDEADEYGDSDLDDEDDNEDEDEDYYSDEDDTLGHEVWSEAISAASMESKTQLSDEQVGSRTNGRVRSDYINSVLNPVENTAQWKAVKTKGTPLLKQQKENISNLESPRMSFSFKANQEIAVDSSLSNWLASPPSKNTIFSGFETTTSDGGCSTPARSFEDRPILGALTVEELRQFSASPSPRKSPSRSPDDMPIIGTVGTYWNNSSSAKHSGGVTSFKGIPNPTSKYTEDKKVNWNSIPFETRLDRALNSVGDAKA